MHENGKAKIKATTRPRYPGRVKKTKGKVIKGPGLCIGIRKSDKRAEGPRLNAFGCS